MGIGIEFRVFSCWQFDKHRQQGVSRGAVDGFFHIQSTSCFDFDSDPDTDLDDVARQNDTLSTYQKSTINNWLLEKELQKESAISSPLVTARLNRP